MTEEEKDEEEEEEEKAGLHRERRCCCVLGHTLGWNRLKPVVFSADWSLNLTNFSFDAFIFVIVPPGSGDGAARAKLPSWATGSPHPALLMPPTVGSRQVKGVCDPHPPPPPRQRWWRRTYIFDLGSGRMMKNTS